MMEWLRNLVFRERKDCHFCGASRTSETFFCKACRERLEAAHEVRRLYDEHLELCYYSLLYHRFARELLTGFKFRNKSYLYKALGEVMVETFCKSDLKGWAEVIIPIPMSREGMAKRGYNQSLLLAKFLSEASGVPMDPEVLLKCRHTRAQSGLSEVERKENVKDSFGLKRPERIFLKKVLLVDDIVTTGATLKEAAVLLKANGAREIRALTLMNSRK